MGTSSWVFLVPTEAEVVCRKEVEKWEIEVFIYPYLVLPTKVSIKLNGNQQQQHHHTRRLEELVHIPFLDKIFSTYPSGGLHFLVPRQQNEPHGSVRFTFLVPAGTEVVCRREVKSGKLYCLYTFPPTRPTSIGMLS